MKLEEAVKELKGILNHIKIANECGVATRGEYHKEKEAIEVVLNHLTKQEKIIELMIDDLETEYNHYEPCFIDEFVDCEKYISCKECIKQYFEKKAEENL